MIRPDPRGTVLLAATATMAMLVLDSSIIGVMLPSIGADFSVSSSQEAWVISVYLLTLAVLLPVGGRLTDKIGPAWAFRCGILGFTIASAGIATVGSPDSLIVWRGLAGATAALLMPATLALLTATYPAPQLTRALAIYTGAGQAFAILGPAIGGLCAQYLGWRYGFLVNVPIGIAGIVLLGRASPSTSLPEAGDRVSGLAFFVSRRFAGAVLVLTALGFAMTVATIYGAIELQNALGLSPAEGGLALLPLVIPMLLVTRWVAKHGTTVSTQFFGVAGSLAVSLGLVLLSVGLLNTSIWVACAGLVPIGAGIALLMGPISAAALSEAPSQARGMASAIITTGRQLGSVVGVVVFACIASIAGSAAGFLAAGAVMGISLCVAGVTLGSARSHRVQ